MSIPTITTVDPLSPPFRPPHPNPPPHTHTHTHTHTYTHTACRATSILLVPCPLCYHGNMDMWDAVW